MMGRPDIGSQHGSSAGADVVSDRRARCGLARRQEAFIEYLKADNRMLKACLGCRRLIFTDTERRLLAQTPRLRSSIMDSSIATIERAGRLRDEVIRVDHSPADFGLSDAVQPGAQRAAA